MAHQFKSDFLFDMDCFGFPSQSMSYPFASTSFSSASSSYDSFTPASRVSTPLELALEPDGSYNNGSHGVDAASLLTVSNFMLDTVETKPEQMPFPDTPPNTPMKQELVGFDYREMKHHGSMDSLAPSSPELYAISPGAVIDATSFVMTPTQASSGFEATGIYSPWSCASESPFLQSNDDVFDIDHQSESPYYVHDSRHIHDTTSREQTRPRQMVMNEIHHKTAELQSAQTRRTRKRAVKPVSVSAETVWSSCDYPGCNKAFRRKEHLKRHKQSFHGEGPNRFSCEFCGKGQFNRRDNLNNHRKLHARRNSHNRGVEFVADAVMVIEQEKWSRRIRTPTRRRKQGSTGGTNHLEIPKQ